MTTETKFTPAPWEVDIFGDVQANGDDVARIAGYYGEEVNDANAHLIAAAPDMYAALQGAREYVAILLAERNRAYAGFAGITDVPDIEACLEQIDAALAKAGGEA